MPIRNPDSLSQNFLKSPTLVSQLIAASDLTSSDTVLEIGPGQGIITTQLIHRVKEVLAIEKDPVLTKKLIESNKNVANLKIFSEDFLKFSLPHTPYKIFANPPFSQTSKILHKIMTSPRLPDSMYFLMQQEAAQKFVGSPETQSSLLCRPWYEINILGDIDRSEFTSKPQINIVFIEFKQRPQSFIKDQDKKEYRAFITYGFSQWQPTFLDSYKKLFTYPQLKKLSKIYHLSGLKLSEVSFDTWLQVFKTYLKLHENIGHSSS